MGNKMKHSIQLEKSFRGTTYSKNFAPAENSIFPFAFKHNEILNPQKMGFR